MANAGTKNGTSHEPEVEQKKIRTSKVRKGIFRKLNVAKYETIDIIVDHEIEVEWKNAAELLEKAKGVTTLVTKDYQSTEVQVLQELNLAGYKAFANEPEVKKPLAKVETRQEFDKL